MDAKYNISEEIIIVGEREAKKVIEEKVEDK